LYSNVGGLNLSGKDPGSNLFGRIQVYIYVYVYIYTYIHNIYTHIHARAHTHTHTHIYTHTHIGKYFGEHRAHRSSCELPNYTLMDDSDRSS